jgi:hypothetical protein
MEGWIELGIAALIGTNFNSLSTSADKFKLQVYEYGFLLN